MAENAKWYVVHTYSGYENTVAASIEKAVENRGLRDLIYEVNIPSGDRHRDHGQRPQDRGAQGIPRLCAGQDGPDRRDLASGAQRPRRHRVRGLWQQGHPPHRRGDRRPGRGKARGRGGLSGGRQRQDHQRRPGILPGHRGGDRPGPQQKQTVSLNKPPLKYQFQLRLLPTF